MTGRYCFITRAYRVDRSSALSYAASNCCQSVDYVLIMNEVALRKRQLSWHADSGQRNVTIEPGGRRRFEVACDVEFMWRNTVCAAGPRFRPGQAAFKANGLGRVWPGFRPDPPIILFPCVAEWHFPFNEGSMRAMSPYGVWGEAPVASTYYAITTWIHIGDVFEQIMLYFQWMYQTAFRQVIIDCWQVSEWLDENAGVNRMLNVGAWLSRLCEHWVTSTFSERNRWLFSAQGFHFANLSTKITNQREFRLSLIFLLSENNKRFCSLNVKVNSAQRFFNH